ncbi:MAG: hypothetical protein M3434_13150 [Gemmatimonadota bacterium]|jgi:hypothetical protein|nr:hypothetical protein [Gemmatimonadota bacterium]
MDYLNDLKGTLTQGAVCCALRHAGYPVVPSSIEALFPMLPLLSGEGYQSLALAPQLRRLPDLLILPNAGAAWQVEVKYRSRITRDGLCQLHTKLKAQQDSHPETHTVLIRSVSPRGAAARADDLIRVLPPRKLEHLVAADIFYHNLGEGAAEEQRLEPLWQSLRTMSSSFPRLKGAPRQLLEQLVPFIRAMAEL